MAGKTKHKSKPVAKEKSKKLSKAAVSSKSFVKKAKASKAAPKPAPKPASRRPAKATPKKTHKPAKAVWKAEVRPAARALQPSVKVVVPAKLKLRENGAVEAYEAALKHMHSEEYEKAIRAFRLIVNEFNDEPEIQGRARVLMQASEKRLQERGRTVLRSADDHYNMGIADLNRRQLDEALTHLQHALKLAPKGDHILYAMAAVNALKGNRDEALTFLKQSIHHRPENRFMAQRDSDFEGLIEDADFKQLVTSSEK